MVTYDLDNIWTHTVYYSHIYMHQISWTSTKPVDIYVLQYTGHEHWYTQVLKYAIMTRNTSPSQSGISTPVILSMFAKDATLALVYCYQQTCLEIVLHMRNYRKTFIFSRTLVPDLVIF